MLALARGLAGDNEVVIGAPRGTRLLEEARRAGLVVKAVDPGDQQDLERWLAATRPDILHIHAGIGWEGHATGRAAHGRVGALFRTEHLPYLLTDAAQREEHRASIAQVDRVICVSQAVAQSHLDAGVDEGAIVTIANGVSPAPPSSARGELRARWFLGEAPVLLLAGRLAPQKGHALLLDALPGILAAHPDTVVLLAGGGSLGPDIAREIHLRGLAGCVRMLGPRNDLPDLMAAADLLVLPSRFEGLSLVALEAMAAGLPIVATEAPGNAELLEPGISGWLAPADDPKAFAAGVIDALRDPCLRGQVAEAARQRQQSLFTEQRMINETSALYESVRGQSQSEGNRVTRIGFVGAGGIARRHFGILEQFDDVAIVAIADVNADCANQGAERFGARAFSTAEDMLAAVDLDALYICVPPFAHGAPEQAAIAAGLPFFVEKPVALDLEVAEHVAAQVEASGLVTGVGYHWRYLDTVDEVRSILQDNPARLLSGYWLDSTPPPQWWWHEDQSGGQMVEQTTHLLDLARYLVGDVVRAYGLAGHTKRADFPGLDVPTVSSASLLFADGTIANFASTCLLGWNHRVGLHLFGDKLAIEITDHDLMVDVGRGRPVRGAEGDPVWRQDRDFIDAVQGKENRIRCTYADALATLRLARAVVDSTRSGLPVTLQPQRESALV